MHHAARGVLTIGALQDLANSCAHPTKRSQSTEKPDHFDSSDVLLRALSRAMDKRIALGVIFRLTLLTSRVLFSAHLIDLRFFCATLRLASQKDGAREYNATRHSRQPGDLLGQKNKGRRSIHYSC